MLAKAAPLAEADLDDLAQPAAGSALPFLVLVDGVTDPGNLGAVLRTADGAGVTGVVLPRHRAVHITPTAAKAAAGAIEHIPIAVVSGLPDGDRTAAQGRHLGRRPGRRRRPTSLFDLGDTAAGAIGLVLGAEGSGLSRLVRQRCDLVVEHPDAGAPVVAERERRGRAGLLRDRPPSLAVTGRPASPAGPP